MSLLDYESTVRGIKESDMNVDKTLAEAHEKASKLLADARRDSANLVSQANEESSKEALATVDSAREAAGKDAEKARKGWCFRC